MSVTDNLTYSNESFKNGLFNIARDTKQSFRAIAKRAAKMACKGLDSTEILEMLKDVHQR